MASLWDELLPMTRCLHGRCVDLGCGNGEYSARLAALPDVADVVSVDVEDEPVRWGKAYRALNPTRRFVRASIDDLSMFHDDEFDCAMAWHVIEHVEDTARALAEIRRVTRHLVMFALPLAVTGREAMYRSPDHVRWWTADEFRAALEAAGFVVASGPYVDQTTSQNWLCATSQMVSLIEGTARCSLPSGVPPELVPPPVVAAEPEVPQYPGPVVVRRKKRGA